MFGNRTLEAIKRLLTADTYVRSHNQPTDRGTSTAGPEHTNPEVPPRPEAS